MQARRARAGTDRSSSRLPGSHSWSSRGQLGAELGLAPGALEEEHEPAGRLECDLAAEVLLHQGQREVHAGGDARRGDHVAVAHEDRVGFDFHPGMAARELGAGGPVRGRAAPVEQAGAGEQEGAGADRGHALRPRRGGGEPVDQALVARGRVDSRAAGGHQRVDPALAAVQGAVGVERDARGGQRARPCGHHLHDVAVAARELGGRGEDLGRAVHVERLHAGEGDYDDAAHARIVTAPAFGRKDTNRTISAIEDGGQRGAARA
jgi:hypothetical protein